MKNKTNHSHGVSAKKRAGEDRHSRIKRLTPERRALLNRIRKRRDAIGTLDFNAAELVRDVRNHG